MAEDCTHNCSTCGKNCGERKEEFDFSAKLNAASKVNKVIAVASGKGGVGKSFVSTMLAVSAMRQGKRVGILDADITGPSIPKAFGLSGGTYQNMMLTASILNGTPVGSDRFWLSIYPTSQPVMMGVFQERF